MTAELTELNALVAEFPPDALKKVIDYARLLTIPPDVPYWEIPGFSSEWTREDELDIARASMIQFDREHPEDEGYDDIPTR